MTTAHPLDFSEEALDAYYTKRDALTVLIDDSEPMTTTELIAAFIAARAPEPRERTEMFDCYFDGSIMQPNVVVNNAHPPVHYRLLPVPGAELCDECPCCGDAHSLPQCKTWAADAGEPLIAGLKRENAALREAIEHIFEVGNFIWSEADKASLFSVYLSVTTYWEFALLVGIKPEEA